VVPCVASRSASASLAREAIERHGALQKPAELEALVDLLAQRPLRRVVEIGSFEGGTLWLWARLAEDDATLVSIDLPAPGASLDGAALRRAAQRLVLLRGDSHARAMRDRCAHELGGPADLLFIDGDHGWAGCRADVELYLPLVRSSGLAVLHDIVPHPQVPSCQVDRVWRELRSWARTLELVDPGGERGWGPWGGLGVVLVP
jgi:predicted O-methyltransferase YrrM